MAKVSPYVRTVGAYNLLNDVQKGLNEIREAKKNQKFLKKAIIKIEDDEDKAKKEAELKNKEAKLKDLKVKFEEAVQSAKDNIIRITLAKQDDGEFPLISEEELKDKWKLLEFFNVEPKDSVVPRMEKVVGSKKRWYRVHCFFTGAEYINRLANCLNNSREWSYYVEDILSDKNISKVGDNQYKIDKESMKKYKVGVHDCTLKTKLYKALKEVTNDYTFDLENYEKNLGEKPGQTVLELVSKLDERRLFGGVKKTVYVKNGKFEPMCKGHYDFFATKAEASNIFNLAENIGTILCKNDVKGFQVKGNALQTGHIFVGDDKFLEEEGISYPFLTLEDITHKKSSSLKEDERAALLAAYNTIMDA